MVHLDISVYGREDDVNRDAKVVSPLVAGLFKQVFKNGYISLLAKDPYQKPRRPATFMIGIKDKNDLPAQVMCGKVVRSSTIVSPFCQPVVGRSVQGVTIDVSIFQCKY